MKNIRRGIFETNSSSTHSLTIVPSEEYYEFQQGKRFLDRWHDVLITEEEYIKKAEEFKIEHPDYDENEIKEYLELMTFNEYCSMDYETFSQSYKTKNGDEVVAFGYYGTDY